MSERRSLNGQTVNQKILEIWKRNWSEWFTVITVNKKTGYEKLTSGTDNPGYKANRVDMETWFGDYSDGIYELRTTGPKHGKPHKVVYVGKTSSAEKGSLMKTIQDYTQ